MNGMQARAARKAATTTTAAPVAAVPAPAAKAAPKSPVKKTAAPKKAKTKVTGAMRAIAVGEAYLEWTMPMEEGTGRPRPYSTYDIKGTNAVPIGADVDKTRVLAYSDFLKNYNATVLSRVFGYPIRLNLVRMMVDGLADQILRLTDQDYRVKIPTLGTFGKRERKARFARNPKTGAPVKVPAYAALAMKASRPSRAFLSRQH